MFCNQHKQNLLAFFHTLFLKLYCTDAAILIHVHSSIQHTWTPSWNVFPELMWIQESIRIHAVAMSCFVVALCSWDLLFPLAFSGFSQVNTFSTLWCLIPCLDINHCEANTYYTLQDYLELNSVCAAMNQSWKLRMGPLQIKPH